MCIPHGNVAKRQGGFVRKEKESKTHIEKVSKSEFEHGDPDFVDERKISKNPQKKQSFFARIFS